MIRTTAWRSRFLLQVGLLIALGFLANGHTVLAQTNEVCPPARSSAQTPSLTAQDVNNGASSLMDFTLAVRQRAIESSRISFGCVILYGAGAHGRGWMVVAHGGTLAGIWRQER